MKDYIHKEFPKSCDPDDFFAQVKRTVNGKPVGKEQINMIINAILKGLSLNEKDVLFDLGCGNGALAVLLFNKILSYHGVDFSDYLIEIAKKNFEKPNFAFETGEADEYLTNASQNHDYTKGLCYGTFSYFKKDSAERILTNLRKKFQNLNRFYIGNIPDKNRAGNFYYDHIDYSNLLEDEQSSIGVWWSMEEFKDLANRTGWEAEFVKLPENFYSAHYRFDAILTPKDS